MTRKIQHHRETKVQNSISLLILYISIPLLINTLSLNVFAQNTSEQVIITNSSIMNHFYKNAEKNFIPHLQNFYRPQSKYDLESLEVYNLDFEENIETFKEHAHELGVCGGYSQIAKSDLKRIQNNLIEQRLKWQKEKQNLKQQKTKINAQSKVIKSLQKLKPQSLKNHIDFITQFRNRIARRSDNSEIKSIKNYIENKISKTSLPHSINLVKHRRTPQKSIHVRVPGKNSEKHIVFGGHIDSINLMFSSVAPGADDNASGSAALIEVLKIFLENNQQPQQTLDFYWYAGEESGLIGSGEIAKTYAQNQTNVSAVLQLDMLGVPNKNHEVFLESDFSSPKLNQIFKDISHAYKPNLSVYNMSCGYPCSDHSSWYQENFPVVFPTSGDAGSNDYNHRIHTSRDTKDTLDLNYAQKISQLTLAFLLHADANL